MTSKEIKQEHRRNMFDVCVLKIYTNEYLNIFESKSCYEQISEYIRIQKKIRTNDTNEYPNKYSDQKYSNIRIFEFIRHTLIQKLPKFKKCILTHYHYKSSCRSQQLLIV